VTPPFIPRQLLPGAPRRPCDPDTGRPLAAVRLQVTYTGQRKARGYFASWSAAGQWLATLDGQREVKAVLAIPLNAQDPGLSVAAGTLEETA
jgi:hypothetical protein